MTRPDLDLDLAPRHGPSAPRKQLVAFYRQLATMYGAGIEIRSALRTLEAGLSNPALRQAVLAVQSTLDRGGSLADGMRRFPNVFVPVHTTLIEAAETSGRTTEALRSIADYEEAQLKLQQRLLMGMAYPFLLLNLALVLPALPDLFVVGFGAFLVQVGVGLGILYGLLAGGYLIVLVLRRWPGGRRMSGAVLWHVPLVAGLVRRQAKSRFLRVLAAMHASGISSVQGIRMAARACGSPVLERAALPAAEGIDRGQTLTESLGRTHLFDLPTIAMIGTGEETGRLDESLHKSAENIEGEARTRIQLLSIAVPLVAYLAVALFVAYKVVSFWSGHYSQVLDP